MKLKRILSSVLLCLTVLSTTAGTMSFMTDRAAGGGSVRITNTDWTVKPYLTFSSPGSFTLSAYNNEKVWDGTLYYSTDARSWTVWTGASVSSASAGVVHNLFLRGSGNSQICRANGAGAARNNIGDILLQFDVFRVLFVNNSAGSAGDGDGIELLFPNVSSLFGFDVRSRTAGNNARERVLCRYVPRLYPNFFEFDPELIFPNAIQNSQLWNGCFCEQLEQLHVRQCVWLS